MAPVSHELLAGSFAERADVCQGMADAARQEGFDRIANWLETLARAGKSHAGRL